MPYAIEHVDIVSLLKTKNKDTMTEDLILLFLVTVLLVATVGTTREYLTEQVKPMSKEDSYNAVVRSLQKVGTQGTYEIFNQKLGKQEEMIMRDEGRE
jgi:hypothetical protein